jgi:2-polyprenyl-3-methyl-5-hydroxy-6-metoxy-1,4-benzoquinol methylase
LKQVFDETSGKFARDIDLMIDAGRYLRGELFVDLAKRLVKPGSAILDYGCGPGRLSLLLAEADFRVRGADTSQGMIAQANLLDRKGRDLRFDLIGGHDDVLEPQSCDAIVCSSVIEYVSSPDELLDGFHRALRDQGTLIISYANGSSIWRWYWSRDTAPNPMAVDNHHVWNWRGFRDLLARHGFGAIVKPKFFESPLDHRPLGNLARAVPFIGSLGIVAARRDQSAASRVSNT